MSWVYLIGAILFEVCGTLSMRASDGFRRKIWILPVAASYLIAISLLSLTLAEGVSIGVAYGVWSASGVALTAIVAKLLFKDPLTKLMGLGIIFIVGGVLLIELGAQHAS